METDFVRASLMKKLSFALVILVSLSMILCGCSSKNHLRFTDDILVCYQYVPYLEESDEAIVNISVFNSGKCVYEKITPSGKQASVEFEIDKSSVKSIQNVIARVNFMELDEDVSTGGENGAFDYITAYADGTSRKSGGLNPAEDSFTSLKEAVLDSVPESAIEECDAKLSDD
ncbi:MAG: hypothetical protein PUB37_07915 [Firmicutes bacterium]|nr:hypothetical protein [Bacillota bacterium]